MNTKELISESIRELIAGNTERASELMRKVNEHKIIKIVEGMLNEKCGRPHGKEQEEDSEEVESVDMEREDVEDNDAEDEREEADIDDYDEEVFRKALEDLEDAELAMKVARAALKWKMEEEEDGEEAGEEEASESEEGESEESSVELEDGSEDEMENEKK